MQTMTRDTWTDDKLDSLNAKIDLRFDHVDERLVRLETQVEAQRSEIQEGFAAIGAKFDQMDAKFGAKFDQMDAKFDAKFDQMDAKFGAKFDQMDAKFDAKFDQMDAKFDARFTSVDSRLDSFHRQLVYVLISFPSILVAAGGVAVALLK